MLFRSSLVRRAVGMLARRPDLAPHARDLPALDVAENPESALLFVLLEKLEQSPQLTTGALVEFLREDPRGPLLLEILGQPVVLDEALWESEFQGVVEQLMRQRRRHRFRDLVAGQTGPAERS